MSFAFDRPLDEPVLTFKKLMSKHKVRLFFGSTLLLLTNLTLALVPRITNLGVSIVENKKPSQFSVFGFIFGFSNIYQIILIIVLLAILGFFIRTFSRVVLFNIGRVIEKEVREKLFFHISIMDDQFFQKQSVGSLMNYLTTDMTNIRLFSGFAILNILNIVFVFATTLPFLFSANKTMAALALLPFPLVIFATSSLTQKMYHKTKEYQRVLGSLQEHVQESLSGAHIIRLFFKHKEESERFFLINQKNYQSAMDLAKVRVLLFPSMRLMIGFCVSLILLMGGLLIIKGNISLGDFIEINARVLQLAWPAMSIGFVLSVFHRGQASLSRINDLLYIKPLIIDGTKNIKNINRIDVENLSFKVSEYFSLNHINFNLKKGQVLGIVGQIACGKSSLLKLLYRRQLAPIGKIFIDGNDINDISLLGFYENVSIVNQEPFLFHQTIKENISFNDPNVSIDEIYNVLEKVFLKKEILNFKNGLDTVIGERGITLSGGQRQRLALARALIKNRPVLILDDALSAVDIETENNLIKSLFLEKNARLTIIATSRISAIKQADEILVMQKGSIIERGTHEELIKMGKYYLSLLGIS